MALTRGQIVASNALMHEQMLTTINRVRALHG
jgi:hypothetical protein